MNTLILLGRRTRRKELEGIEEDKLLEIHRAFQQKLKERDVE